MAYEQPRYEVVRSEAAFELRRYLPYLVAEVSVTGDFDDVGNQAFRILAGYINGNNRSKESIAMTAPVSQTPAGGERIAMTAPVIQAPEASQSNTYRFSFMMPSRFTLETLPFPTDARINLRQVDARLMAVRTYSGSWSKARYQENEGALLAGVKAAGLKPVGEPIFARYNSPFTLWFLRRNEVMVEVEAPAVSPQP